MKKAAVIYKTKYGAAEVYAKHIASVLQCDIFTLEESKKVDLSAYSAVVYGGGVHAGGVRGFDVFEKTVKKYREKVDFTIFTCGMNVQNFEARAQLRDVNFSKSYTKGLTCYFFDGKFEPEKVTGLDKGIIKWTRKLLSEKGELNLTKDDRALMEKIDNGFDGIDVSMAEPLINHVKEILNEG